MPDFMAHTTWWKQWSPSAASRQPTGATSAADPFSHVAFDPASSSEPSSEDAE